MSDIVIEFRVKNGRLKRAILAKWPSYRAFATANYLPYQSIIDLLGMRKSAYGRDDWRAASVDIATALRMEPEELWPDELRRATLRKNGGEFLLTLDEAAALPAARTHIDRRALAELTSSLTRREMEAITAAVRGQPLHTTGKGLGADGGDVGVERVRQIRDRALRKIRFKAYVNKITLADVASDA